MFRNKIGYWADTRGFKHKHLAKECGVSIQTFSRWVRNVNQPDLEKAFLLSRILDVSINEMCEWID